jgi:hypothetical protein
MYDPVNSNFLMWWPVWRVDDKVFVQNQMLFLDHLEDPFNLLDPFRHIGDRSTISEDGRPISEWTITSNDMAAFVEGHNTN